MGKPKRKGTKGNNAMPSAAAAVKVVVEEEEEEEIDAGGDIAGEETTQQQEGKKETRGQIIQRHKKEQRVSTSSLTHALPLPISFLLTHSHSLVFLHRI
jgi:hypothetical protein